ncbi:MAG: translation elongation factor Ts [Candidatus Peribacteraceae bacterium]
MSVTASQVSELRARTGVGILDAKNALEEANGNEEQAIEILRKRGKAQAVKKADRAQGEGIVFIAKAGTKAAAIIILCETDFVARSDAFKKLGGDLAMELASKGQAGFDALAAEKIPAAVLELGENISLGETKLVDAPVIGSYVHLTGKIGVLVGLSKGTEEQANDVCMHAAAMNPQYVRPSEVSEAQIVKEKEIWNDQMKDDKKPQEIKDKILTGKEKKFREENALLTQPFVKDTAKTVEGMLGGDVITEYVRLSLA